ncbi:hypothetical protein CRYUN_Cryun02cG0045700 [Craigia yunnanensis]
MPQDPAQGLRKDKLRENMMMRQWMKNWTNLRSGPLSAPKAVKLERLRTGDVDNSSVDRLSSGLLDSEKRNVEITVQQARTVDRGSLSICGLTSLDVDNLSVVRNLELACVEKTGNLASAYMDDAETGSSRRILNCKGGGVGVDQEVVKPCNQTAELKLLKVYLGQVLMRRTSIPRYTECDWSDSIFGHVGESWIFWLILLGMLFCVVLARRSQDYKSAGALKTAISFFATLSVVACFLP